MHGLTKVTPFPAAGLSALPEQRDAEEDREMILRFKCDACGKDMRVGHCIPAQPVKIHVGAHHIGITK